VAALVALPLLALAAPATAASDTKVVPPPPMGHFSHPTRIDNPYFPLVPGTEYFYKGTITEAGTVTPHTVTFTVTDLTKVIDGVTTRVVLDVDNTGGEVVEAELAFFAQDDNGTVWNMGEYPEEFDNGTFTGAPDTWITGLSGAQGGIHMLAHPHVGDTYTEGLVRSIGFYDVTTVFATGQRVCVPVSCYTNVLVTHETSPLDPTSGTQVKYYAPGVGLVKVGAIGGDSQERLVLSSLRHLGSSALQAVDQQVRMMDRRGHRASNVYARTAPVQ
jgi:hypothetical protein